MARELVPAAVASVLIVLALVLPLRSAAGETSMEQQQVC